MGIEQKMFKTIINYEKNGTVRVSIPLETYQDNGLQSYKVRDVSYDRSNVGYPEK